MAVRIEWSTAKTAGVEIISADEKAPDGQRAAYSTSEFVLLLGCSAIEGTRVELLQLLADATRDLAYAKGSCHG